MGFISVLVKVSCCILVLGFQLFCTSPGQDPITIAATMSYVTHTTRWLGDEVDANVKALITGFYELADSKSDDAGPRMASEIFSPDAVLVTPNGTFRGKDGMLFLSAVFFG